MKTPFFFLIVTLLFFACDKKDIRPTHKLTGKWNWKSSCGGVVGCTFSSATNTQILTIDNSKIEIKTNGNVTFNNNYITKSITTGDNSRIYEIEISDGAIWKIAVSDNNLSIEKNSFIISYYERTK